MKANIIKSNFTGGEISPLLYGRIEIPRYQNGAEKVLNCIVIPTGGCTRAWGTKYVDNAGAAITTESIRFSVLKKDATPPVVQGYRVQFRSDGKIRFYTNDALILSGGNPYEINHPFTALSRIRYEQFDNVLYLFHPDVAPQKLTRTSDTSWTIAAASFTMPASQSVSSITRSGSTATATTAANHGYATGDLITMAGADQSEYNGTFQITKTGDNTYTYAVTGTPATPATGTITAQKVHWHANFGYPAAVTFFEQRMIMGGMKAHPQTVLGSKNGEPTNLQTGTGDSDPFSFTLAVATGPIYHLIAPAQQIVVLTGREEILIKGSSDKALTPTNVQIRRQTKNGTVDTVAPLDIDSEILFVSRYSKKLRLLGYTFEQDRYKATDQTIIADHMLASGISGIDASLEPHSIVWIVTPEGKLVVVTFDKDQEVTAFARIETDGVIKEVTVIPGTSLDRVWLTIERTIGGTTYTYNEYFDAALNTHCAYTGTDASGKAIWTGLNHLEGKNVDIIADGSVMPQQTVASGQITLPRNAKSIEIGLHYDSEIIDLPIAIQTAIGNTRGMTVSVNEIYVLLYNSVGCEINGEVVPFRKFGAGVLDEPVTPFTGLKKVQNIGWNEGKVTIKQTQPLPFTALAIIKKVTFND